MKTTQKIMLLFVLVLCPFLMHAQENSSTNSSKEKPPAFHFKKLPEETNTAIKSLKDYNQGLAFYNNGVDLLISQNYGTTLDSRDWMNSSREQFKLALPHFEKAYKLNPKDKNIIHALTGVYYGLGEKEKYNTFKKEFDSINKPGK